MKIKKYVSDIRKNGFFWCIKIVVGKIITAFIKLSPKIQSLGKDINRLWIARRFEIKYEELTPDNYNSLKHIEEAEHQIGRIMNLEAVIKKIATLGIEGDFVEFGTYQGLYLIWLARFREKYGLQHRKIIGIDSLEGLPCDSTVWHKGTFNNTSLNVVSGNLKKYLTDKENKNIELIKGLFSQESVKNNLHLKTNKLSLMHLDADLKSSTLDALFLLEPYFLENNIKFLMFDDLGCHPDEVPLAFREWKTNHCGLNCELFGETLLTKYFMLTHDFQGISIK